MVVCMELKSVVLADVFENLELIRMAIPEKATLTVEEVRQRLYKKVWGGVLVLRKRGNHRKTMGIVVWYELDTSMYIWMGAVAPEYSRCGVCSHAFRYLEKTTAYQRWVAKTSAKNITAQVFLAMSGFVSYEYEVDSNTMLFERLLKGVGR